LNKKQEEGPPALCSWPFYYIHGVACDVFVDPFKVTTFVFPSLTSRTDRDNLIGVLNRLGVVIGGNKKSKIHI
jgi:hypothetical protein